MYYYFGFGVVAIVVIWIVGSYLVIRNIEEPKFTILENRDGYDIREYAPYIVAETEVTGDYNEATREGFRLIADYIFGNNTAKAGIAMTAPVLENSSEKISMTTPVLDTENENKTRTISFVLPSKYTLDTLPKPNNPAVRITEVPSRKVAVLAFTWYPTIDRVESKKAQLIEFLKKDNVEIIGNIQTARYNPPLSMPLTLRNEIIIPIQ